MNFELFKASYEKIPVTHYFQKVPECPIVSVCIQTYQHSKFIKECLDGILMQQTPFPFEILLGEDDSTDGTREICIEYAEKYPAKIRLFLHHRENNIKINGSPTGRFNFLYNLYSAQGKYIAVCEGDDYWTDPLKLQKQVDFLESNLEVAGCFHDSITVDASSRQITNVFASCNYQTIYHQKDCLTSLWSFYATSSLVFRQNVLAKEHPKCYYKSFYDTTLDLMITSSGSLAYLSFTASVYRIHGGGVWSPSLASDKHLSRLNQVRCFIRDRDFASIYSKELLRLYEANFNKYWTSLGNESNPFTARMKKCLFYKKIGYLDIYFFTKYELFNIINRFKIKSWLVTKK